MTGTVQLNFKAGSLDSIRIDGPADFAAAITAKLLHETKESFCEPDLLSRGSLKMSVSKRPHVLAVLRAALNLNQTELAELANCSLPTVKAVETGRLPLSDSLAARISTATGAGLDWLRANDLNRPLPAIGESSELVEQFKELFASARLTVADSERESLALYIALELTRLKSGSTLSTVAGNNAEAAEV